MLLRIVDVMAQHAALASAGTYISGPARAVQGLPFLTRRHRGR